MQLKAVQAVNLSTGAVRLYTNISPSMAVISAYAQACGDWNTWEYRKYRKKLVYGAATVACGDWCAIKNKPYPATVSVEGGEHEQARRP
jgi:hypothetical protein